MLRRTIAVIAAASLLALAACSDGDSVDPEADADLIEDAILTLDDLPEGFEEGDPNEDEEGAADECIEDETDLGEDEIEDARTAKEGPAEFRGPDGNTTVTADISAFEDGDVPERLVEALASGDVLDCIAEGVEGEGVLSNVEIDEVDLPGDAADLPGIGIVVTGELAAIGAVVELQQYAVVVGERFGVSVSVSGLAGEIDDDLAEDALDAMLERLEDA